MTDDDLAALLAATSTAEAASLLGKTRNAIRSMSKRLRAFGHPIPRKRSGRPKRKPLIE